MDRRSLLATISVLALPGCAETGSPSTGSPASETPTNSPSQTAPSTAGATCEPEAVFRPSPPEGAEPEPSEYPEKPATLSADSVATYLSSFETAYARNRTISDVAVTSVDVEIQGGFDDASETGDGYVASSNVQIMYTREAEGTETPSGDVKYVANYYVDLELVYWHRTDLEPMDPRDSDRKLLVQCESTA